MTSSNPRPHLSTVLPPLIFGTATFNNLYNKDPYALDTTSLVSSALSHGIRAFDTSPYYGPAESLLGAALSSSSIQPHHPRSSYLLITKVGRISASSFDYSPSWVRKSIARSLERLQTDHLDLAYCHDVEFVSAHEVLAAVSELRRLRDQEGKVRYVGISGYPLDVLCGLAELVRERSGEPLDAVLSYAHFTLQNRALGDDALRRLAGAGVGVVMNASALGMGLLRGQGPPVGSSGDWHPAPEGLRRAAGEAAKVCEGYGEKLEDVALRWALEEWARVGAVKGVGFEGIQVGPSVIGVSTVEELEATMRLWKEVLKGLADGHFATGEANSNPRNGNLVMAKRVRDCLGDWTEYAWDSPPKGFSNTREMEPAEAEGK